MTRRLSKISLQESFLLRGRWHYLLPHQITPILGGLGVGHPITELTGGRLWSWGVGGGGDREFSGAAGLICHHPDAHQRSLV